MICEYLYLAVILPFSFLWVSATTTSKLVVAVAHRNERAKLQQGTDIHDLFACNDPQNYL